MDYKILHLETHGDERGGLISLENMRNVPFEIKRVYYIFNTLDGVRRGFHAHKNLKQVLICVNGSCVIHLDDGKGNCEEILLNDPSKGLFIESNLWREMYGFSSGAVLLVLASEIYSEDDYIRDYSDFIKYVNGGKLS